MSTMTHDNNLGATPFGADAERVRLTAGLAFAVVSAVTFGMSGALARGLFDTGWSPGAITLVRVGLAAAVLTPFGLASLRGRWWLLRRNLGLVTAYGAIAVAGAQFCFFSAVQHMQVGPALLIEYTAPAVVVAYLWLRHGQQPGRLTLVGAGLAALGLVLVLDLVSGAHLSPVGVLWALAAMVGNATYFIINSHEDNGLPPLVLAWSGLLVGAVGLGLLAFFGVLPMHGSTVAPSYAGAHVAWWEPLATLGLVTAAVAYVTGIQAGRRLGSRLASFVALLEVVAGVFWAWLLLSELPGVVQLFGGLFILAGVVAVKLGERSVTVREPSAA
jgi:drug/metabolite transporter (DMT)-like permease